MDKARSFEFVYRLPVDTLQELQYKEQVYDHQVLLNENWSVYARRSGQGHRSKEFRVKRITETWEENGSRKPVQHLFLEEAAVHAEMESERRLQIVNQVDEASKKFIAHVMAFQEHLAAERTPCRHSLFVDFDRLQQRKFAGEQNIVMTAEYALRLIHLEYEGEMYKSILHFSHLHQFLAITATRKRLKEEEEERQRVAEEERRAMEEMRLKEEMRQKELEEAERARKEAMEQQKILDRKRREEERRAKLRMERERHKQSHNSSNTQESSVPEDVLQSLTALEVKAAVEPVKKDEGTS